MLQSTVSVISRWVFILLIILMFFISILSLCLSCGKCVLILNIRDSLFVFVFRLSMRAIFSRRCFAMWPPCKTMQSNWSTLAWIPPCREAVRAPYDFCNNAISELTWANELGCDPGSAIKDKARRDTRRYTAIWRRRSTSRLGQILSGGINITLLPKEAFVNCSSTPASLRISTAARASACSACGFSCLRNVCISVVRTRERA